MQKKRVVILGAGISGLAAAWQLSKRDDVEIEIFEKEGSAGGLIKNARVFKTSSCQELLQMAGELDLKPIFSQPKKRFILRKGKLVKPPKFSWSLLKEWSVPVCNEEESVWDFAVRRFDEKMAKYVFDPLVVGVFGGDAKKLSIDACFPFIKAMEKRYGSLTKALFLNRKKDSSFFSFEGGNQTIIDALLKNIRAKIHYHTEVKDLKNFDADAIFCALPNREATIAMQNLVVVTLCYSSKPHDKEGFGYLVPTCENETILGVIFEGKNLVVLCKENSSMVIDAVQRHLKIKDLPNEIIVEKRSIPQYTLGHRQRVELLQQRFSQNDRRLYLLGNYLSGASVNDCIRQAFTSIKAWEGGN